MFWEGGTPEKKAHPESLEDLCYVRSTTCPTILRAVLGKHPLCVSPIPKGDPTKLRLEQSPPSTLTSLRPLQQVPPHPRDFDFPSLRVHSKHEGTNMKCKPNCVPGGTLIKTRLASCSGDTGGIHWRILARRSGSILAGYSAVSTSKGYSRDPRRDTSTGEQLWRDTRRDPPASRSGGILGGMHRRAALAGYSAGSTRQLLWRDTRRDPPASCSGGISADSTGKLLWRDIGRDPLASCFGGILGGIHRRAALAGNSAGSTGKQLWRDTRRDPPASCSGGILGGIHWQAALAGYSAGSTGELLWRDTRRDPLPSCSVGILGGTWCRSIANADSNIKSNHPFLSGGATNKLDPRFAPPKSASRKRFSKRNSTIMPSKAAQQGLA